MTDVAAAPPQPLTVASVTTLVTRVRERARHAPDGIAMREKKLGVWQGITWSTYWDRIQQVGHALIAFGVEPGDRVAIHSENRPEWLFTDLATIAARGITVGLYPTNPAHEVRHILADSGAKILVAEDQEQVDKVLAVAHELPDLRYIVYIDPRGVRGSYTDSRLVFWQDFLAAGERHRAEHPGALEQLLSQASPDDIMTIVYTSGTTGPPKGAMLSVAEVEFSIDVLVRGRDLVDPPPNDRDIMLSYLPLCHLAERCFTTWFNAEAGVQINFAESIATVPANLREVQPTLFLGVPRIWEKLLTGVTVKIASASPVKRAIVNFWLRVAERVGTTLVRTGGRHTVVTRLLYGMGWLCVYRSLRDRIGVRMVRYGLSGAAPIAPEVLQFFMGIGVPIHEAYGMTESGAVATSNRPGRIKLGTVGEPCGGIEVNIDERTGEVLLRHPGLFAGYWRNAEATADVIDADGWLHTGDVGQWVDGTHLKITDRMKDIIITAGGKNLTPSEVENALKASPYIKDAVVIGDRRPYCSALIGIELDAVGDWAQRRRIPYTTYRDLSEKPEVIKLVQQVVDDTNPRFATVAQIKKFRMLPKELDHEDGEVTATQKVKRVAVEKAYAELVESMYGGRST